MTDRVAEVALATAVGENGLYHYIVPGALVGVVRAGTLAHVPFGSRELPGVVFDPDATPPAGHMLKPIRAVLDPTPVVTEAGIALARWTAAHYACPIPDVLAAMLPPGLARRTVYHISRVDGADDAAIGRLTPTQRATFDLVPAHDGITLERLTREGGKGAARAVVELVKRGALTRTATMRRGAPKTVRVVAWTGKAPEGRVGPKGRAVLAVLRRAEGSMLVSELGRHVAGGVAALAPLQRQGAVAVTEEVVRRDPVAHRPLAPTSALPLTDEQESALESIVAALRSGVARTFLLHGITGSGKTEVYLQALAAVARLGRQGIVLVPEISLTPQTMDRFAARFPGRVALLHSGLSEGERLDEWERARAGTVDAVVGARSAIFSPLPRPGLIVLDEEHDASYKQDRAPRYHTRDVAIRLAEETGAVVVLGSATPDVTSYYAATHGAYGLLKLTRRAASGVPTAPAADRPAPGNLERQRTPIAVGTAMATAVAGATTPSLDARGEHGEPGGAVATLDTPDGGYATITPVERAFRPRSASGAPRPHAPVPLSRALVSGARAELPPVDVVDLREELHAGNRSIFSRALQDAVRAALARREQIILFLNRRGSATFVICRDCGFVAHCPYCELPYTYHGSTEELICHRCDDRIAPPTVCKRCGGWRIRYFGLGTQRVEEEAGRHFPGARLLRWDRDVVNGRHGHEHTLDRFARGEADILVGTQMVAKGLDIPRVTVVGVISADTALNLPDFRAAERTFQTLPLVAGRAGRHSLPGRVVVQTYAPEHFAIQAASEHDYAAFYEQELRFRAETGYPPFARLLRLVYGDPSEEVCRAEGDKLAARLRSALTLVRHGEVIGPAPCFIGKIEGRYLWQVLVRADDVHPLLPLVPPGWTRDVDPMSLL